MPRKQKKYHFIYRTTCQITGKFYVGMHSTDELEDGYLGSGKILGYSLAKHGRENHKREVLEMLPNRRALKLREKEIVNEELLSNPLCINLKYGGEGGWDHIPPEKKIPGGKARILKLTFEERSKAMQTRVHRYGDHFLGHRKVRTGMLHRPDTRAKIGLTNAIKQAGELNSQFGTVWVTNSDGSVKIKKQDLDAYLKKGYVRGRKKVTGDVV